MGANDFISFLKENTNPISILGMLSGTVLFILIANSFLNAESGEAKISEISANNIGLNLFGNFLLPFEVLALLLTAAAIGAIILVVKDKEKENAEKTNIER